MVLNARLAREGSFSNHPMEARGRFLADRNCVLFGHDMRP